MMPRVALAGVLWVAAAQALSGAVEKVFNLEFFITEGEVPKGRPDGGGEVLRVVVAGTWFSWERSGGGAMVCDFADKRIRRRGAGSTVWEDVSLYSDVALRAALVEDGARRQREWLMAGAAAEAGRGNLFELQTLHGVKAGDGPAGGTDRQSLIARIGKDDERSYTSGGELAAQVAFSKKRVPKKYRDMYARFIVYFCRLHPEIRDDIIAEHKAPGALVMRWLEGREW
ncbi:MAG: hypothetical protein LBM92_08330, partial [Opitutaceae bacterium]|nr:hypothetical protein [Opitutaceae bacterium]